MEHSARSGANEHKAEPVMKGSLLFSTAFFTMRQVALSAMVGGAPAMLVIEPLVLTKV